MASTKLIVLKSKEIIYTIIFLALVILLIIILSIMFKQPDNNEENIAATSESTVTDTSTDTEVFYNPGTYNSTLSLGDTTLSVVVTVDEESITDVSILNLDETITTMYPLLESSVEDINTQLQYVSSVDNITYSNENHYTAILICNAIKAALENAVKQ